MKINNNIFKLSLSFIFFSVFMSLTPAEGAMNDYCITPPFVSQNIAPNVMVILDNSLSMEGGAYLGTFDPTQFVNGHYYGYFDPTKNYQYTTSSSPSRWVPIGPTGASISGGNATNPIVSGDVLNWATMKRVDVSKKILIGGRASSGTYALADRTTAPVKLYGHSTGNFNKDLTGTSSQISFPFAGVSYNWSVNGRTLNLTNNTTPGPINVLPTSNVNVPAVWTVYPTATSAYADVDDPVSGHDNDTSYVRNSDTTTAYSEPILLGYNKSFTIPPGVIASVTVKVTARKTDTSWTAASRSMQGVLRMKGSPTDTDWPATTSNLTSNYVEYSFAFNNNPATTLPWDPNDLTGSAANSLVGFGVKAITTPSGTNYYRVTRIYLVVTIENPDGSYNIIVDQGTTPASGILDAMSKDVRFGLSYYDTSYTTVNGGKVDVKVDFGSVPAIVQSITNMDPSTATPLAETLYEVVRYFRQDAPAFSAGHYARDSADPVTVNDPYFFNFTDPTATDKRVPCAKTFVLYLTDGESTYDQATPGTITSAPYSACTLTNIKACSGYGGLPNPRFAGTPIGTVYTSIGTGAAEGRDHLIDVAYWARTNDMRPGSCSLASQYDGYNEYCLPGNQNIILYPVFLFGSGSTLLKDAAIYGGFTDLNGNNKPDCTTIPSECYKSDGSGDPLTYFEGDDGYKLEASITNALEDILKRVTSGTAASVLASGEGSGANLLQAVFYPLRKFSNGSSYDEITWTGRISNLWYYVDPKFATSNIRAEDGDGILNLKATTAGSTHDYITSLYFDKSAAKAKASRWEDPNGDGMIGTQLSDIDFELLGNLWEAGTLLWKRDVTTAAGKRKIYTTIDGTSLLAGNFSSNAINPDLSGGTADADNSATLASYLSVTTAADASKLINWVQGVDASGYRSRTIKIESIDSTARVWKLGDIVNSTPKISSWVALNAYDKVYGDLTYGITNQLEDPADETHFITSAAYKKRGMVFTGGNDGMLHAFKLGTLQLKWSGQGATEKARLLNPDTGAVCKGSDGAPCGKEMWAFIPKNALPYLKYMTDSSYCHVYSVDLTPYIFDASIGGLPDDARTVSSWKTILIGGMKFGGACKKFTDTCTSPSCVKTPIANVGYSSYFALDITDQNNPKLLWEFSDPDLGFASSGPAVVRISGKTGGMADPLKNGNWFVIFGSGPTGPISTSDHQFMGQSDQSLKLFILDLRDGTVKRKMDAEISIPNAFAGSLVNSTLDTDGADYQDEVVYVPYIKKCTADTAAPSPLSSYKICANGTWTNGGLGRLSTLRDPDPSNWKWSTVLDDIGPVPSAVTKIVDKTNGNLWVYFGTGRYYFTQSSADDESGQRYLFGIKDPCFTSSGFTLDCNTAAVPTSSVFSMVLTDVTNTANVPTVAAANSSSFKGWYLALDQKGTYTYAPDPATDYSAERMITDPLASFGQAAVFFTTYKPTGDICSFGGKSFIWVTQYNTGGKPELLGGKALIQVSTGAIEQKDLSSAFADAGGRKSAAMEGKPPEAQGLSIISGPPPTRKVIHIKER
jgi:type IV pilus assembly protein PilY1